MGIRDEIVCACESLYALGHVRGKGNPSLI